MFQHDRTRLAPRNDHTPPVELNKLFILAGHNKGLKHKILSINKRDSDCLQKHLLAIVAIVTIEL